jgi:sRNA-binding protein
MQVSTHKSIVILSEWFPKAFFVQVSLRGPLKHGIGRDLEAALPNFTRASVNTAVRKYMRTESYLAACAVAGAVRIDLKGWACGVVTAEEAAGPQARIVELAAREAEAARIDRARQAAARWRAKFELELLSELSDGSEA